MSAAFALVLALAAPAPGNGYALNCSASAVGGKSFSLNFIANGGALSAIVVRDADGVLDPLGHIMVYESSGGGMTQHLPPKAKPKYTGKTVGETGFVFNGTDRAMTIELTLTSRGDGKFDYSFTGVRVMDSTMRGDFRGVGSCVAIQAPL